MIRRFMAVVTAASMMLCIVPCAMALDADAHTHNGFKAEIAGFDFENYNVDDTITKAADKKYDSTDTYYMSIDTITIAQDDAQHGKVAQFTGSSGKEQGIGIGKSKITKHPDKVKAEVEIKRTANKAVYLQANGISGGMNYELMLWGSNGDIKFSNDGTRSDAVENISADEWCKITLYFDFAEDKREYCAYINDSFVGTYTIPSNITGGIKEFCVTAQTTVSVDNFKLYALPDEFEVKQVTPADGATSVAADTDVVITFSNNLSDSFEDTMVSVESDGNVPEYSVTPYSNTVTIAFVGDLDSKEDYTVILSKDIQDIYEQTLGEEDIEISFTTAVYLSDGDKIEIKTAINGGNSADEIEVLLTADYKEKMGLDSKYYTDNVYNTLYEQKPYDTYDEVVAMIIKTDSLLTEINNAQSSDYTGIFMSSDGEIALFGAKETTAYSQYETFRDEINAGIKNSAPFEDFKALRMAFDAAVEMVSGIYCKSYDYNRVIFFEDFDGDNAIDTSTLTFDDNNEPTFGITTVTTGTTSIKEHGSVVRISLNNKTTPGNYFRVWYGDSIYPVQSRCKVEELSKMQFSIDICLKDYAGASLRFYDKYSNSSKTKGDTLVTINKDGTITFLNTNKQLNYETNKWLCFDAFLDFETDKYTLYINNELAVKDIPLSALDTCAESIGVTLGARAEADSYKILVDNFRIAIPQEFEMKSSQSMTNLNVADSIKIEFSNELPDEIVQSMVEVTSTGNVPSFTVDKNGNYAVISFSEALDFGTPYTIKFKSGFCDLYGQILGEEKSISLATISKQLTASLPEFSDKVRSRAVNPTEGAKNVALIVVKRNADGTVVVLSDEKELAAGVTLPLEVNFNADSLNEGESVYAFVTDGITSLNLLREEYVSPDEVYDGNVGAATLSLTKTELVGTQLDVAGKLSGRAGKNVVISLIDSNNTPKYAFLMQTNEKGEFAHSISVDGFSYGTYYVCATGYSLSGVNRAKVVYLSDIEKEQIKAAINGANSPSEIEAVLKSDTYKEKINLAGKYYNSNVYTTLYEQKNFATYDKAIEMVFKAENLREEINSADWSEYSGILCPNASVILKGADKLSVYNSYNDNQKNEVNKIIVESAPFDTFTTLRSAFDAAVTKYAKSLVDNGNGGGGGGGGAPSRIPDTFGIGTEITQETQNNTNELFTDMSQAAWAQSSVQKLYNMGIVSADTQYRPHDNVKREEFVKMLVQLAGISTESKTAQFTDVNGNEWYASYLGAAQAAGIIKGSDNGSFGVGASITRQDMVVMALRTVEVMNKTLRQTNEQQVFSDSAEISDYATDAVFKMQSAGVISGMGNGLFEPKGLANRAQAAVIICNLIDALV